MIQKFSRYSFTVVLTMLIALNMDIPLQGNLDSFNPAEREPVRENLLQENRFFAEKNRNCVCSPQLPGKPADLLVLVSQPVQRAFWGTQSLFLLNRILRL